MWKLVVRSLYCCAELSVLLSTRNCPTFGVISSTNNRRKLSTLNCSNRSMTKFCANLSFMFTEKPFLERYKAANDAGFTAVETGFPFQLALDDVCNAKKNASLEQVLINIYTGDVTKDELGFAAVNGREEEFKQSLERTLEYAKNLGARKIHVMSGKVENPTIENDAIYVKNLRYAAEIFQKENVIGVIEPINKYSVPGYYLNSYDKAIAVLKEINSSNLKLMLDIFHCQHIRGNISNTIKELKDFIGHVQIAQVPNRNEPDSDGELNYQFILQELQAAGYNDFIGLEYKPIANPVDGLKWINKFGYKL